MKYNQIFIDRRNRPEATSEQENFASVTVYSPESYRDPYLVEFEHGNNNYEDWETDWETWNHPGLGDSGAIREAISRLDTYVFKDTLVF